MSLRMSFQSIKDFDFNRSVDTYAVFNTQF